MQLLLDYSLMVAGRKPLSVWRMRGTTFVSTNGRYELVETQYGSWRVHCRCCQWDDWAKGFTHADAMNTAYAHVAACPRQP
jgi:hypothetical protein